MLNEFTLPLLRLCVFSSLAIALLLAVRIPLRRHVDAALGYQAWLIVPLVTLAAMLPRQSATVRLIPASLGSVSALAEQTVPLAGVRSDWLLYAWLAGTVASGMWMVIAHRAFLRSAGALARSDNFYTSSADIGPASVGLFSPTIIVPCDFTRRYSAQEQSLVLAHEQIHIDRHDAWANLLVAAYQVVFWFNPIVHIGARCFRQDQELSCDALIVLRHPDHRRAYGEALIKFHTGVHSVHAGINCHWQTHHPTRERLMNLYQKPSVSVRRFAGRCIVALFACGAIGGTLSVRAESAALVPSYAVAVTLDTGSGPAAPLVLTAPAAKMDAARPQSPQIMAKPGDQFSVASGEWRVEIVMQPGNTPANVWVRCKLYKGSDIVSTPTLLALFGEKATIKVGDGDRAFTVSMVVSAPT